MKKIIHISDLHFGREDPNVVEILLNDIMEASPSVVIVSGDLTQRARRAEFKKAAHFLQQIPFPKIVVPGNHDVPLYDVTRRFLAPFNRYIRYINDDFFPTYKNDLMTVIGINTAYSFTWKSGRVTLTQLKTLEEKFKSMPETLKILVIHHPYHEIFKTKHFHNLSDLGIDLILSGHLHQSSASVLEDHVEMLNYKTLIVQAGTAISTRLRDENNSYNLIEVGEKDKLTIAIKEFQNQQFQEKLRFQFKKKNNRWY